MQQLIISKLQEFKHLVFGFILCALLLSMRIKITQSFFFLFLVWNLFLAFIPYGCTLLLLYTKSWQTSRWKWIPITGLWLLFLPNTPYLISDLQHLKHSDPSFIWFDILLLTAFVWYALFIFFLTVRDMQGIVSQKIKPSLIPYATIGVFILCGFGIYLGRFLRWNSWDIIQDPLGLLSDVWHRIRHPFINSKTWMVTFGYATLMTLVFYGMQFNTKKHL